MDHPKPETTVTDHLLEVSQVQSEEEEDEALKDYLEQNLVIAREIQKCDQELGSFRWLIYRAWVTYCFYLLFKTTSSYMRTGFDPLFKEKSIFGDIYPYFVAFLYTEHWLAALICCFFIWKAFFQKSIEDLQRAIFIYKFDFCISSISTILLILNYCIVHADNKMDRSVDIVVRSLTIVNIIPAFWMRDIFIKRKKLCDASSFNQT